MRKTLDEIDKKIIQLLQDNARITIKEIAATVYLSSPAVTARMERLEQLGIIEGYHAQVNSDALGYKIKAFINLEMDSANKQEFYSIIENNPNVIECNCVTGEYSKLLKVEFLNTTELDFFVDKLQKYGKTKTQIVFSTIVEHFGLPIEDGAKVAI